MKPGVLLLVVTLACLLDYGSCSNFRTTVSPPDGTVVVEFLGPANVSFNCDQFSNITTGGNSTGNFTQRTTVWTIRFASDPDTRVIFNSLIHLEFEASGIINDPPAPFPTLRNILTIVNFTERLDGTQLSCGQGSDLENTEWTLRIYRPPTLRANFSVKVVESDGNIPVDLGLEPVAFPTPGVFQWSKDGMIVNSNSEINYTYPTAIFQRLIRRADSGDYSLTATNHRLDNTTVEVGTGRGNFILDVLYGPDITPGPMQHYVLVGDSVSLVCGTSLVSNPAAAISWRDIQGMEIQNAGRYTFNNGPDTVQLNFSFTRASDTGVWTCGIVVIDNDVMTASEGRLVPRDNKEIGEEMYPIMLTVVVPPSEPRIVAVDNISAAEAILSWREPEDLGQPLVTRYEITADDLTNEPIVSMTETNATNGQTISGLLPGVMYQFTVRAITEGGNVVGLGNASTPVNRTTLLTVPAPVCETAASANGTITVSWSFTHIGGVPLTNLSVFYTFLEGLNSVNGTEKYVGVGDTSVMVTGLEAGTTYTFSVIAVNSEGSAVSQCTPEIHREGIPPGPKPPVVVVTGLDRVQITLNTVTPGVTGNGSFYYDVRYGIIPSTDSNLIEVTYTVPGGGMTVEKITGLTQGLTYIFSARSRNNFGMSDYVTSTPVTLDGTIATTTSSPVSPSPVSLVGPIVGGVIGGIVVVVIIILIIVVVVLLVLRCQEGGSYQVSKSRNLYLSPSETNRVDSSAGVKIEEVAVDIGDDIQTEGDKELHYAELETFRPPSTSAQKPPSPEQVEEPVEYATIQSFKKADNVPAPSEEDKVQTAATNV